MVLTRNKKRQLEKEIDTPAPETPAMKVLREMSIPRQFAVRRGIEMCRDYEDMYSKTVEYCGDFKDCANEEEYMKECRRVMISFIINVYFALSENSGPVEITERELWACFSRRVSTTSGFLDHFLAQSTKEGEILEFDNDTAELIYDLKTTLPFALGVLSQVEFEQFDPVFDLVKCVKIEHGYRLEYNAS